MNIFMNVKTFISILFICFGFSIWLVAYAGETSPKPAVKTEAVTNQVKRSKNIDFEDTVVEGLNGLSRTSAENTATKDGRAKKRLYSKRTHFDPETKESARDQKFVLGESK